MTVNSSHDFTVWRVVTEQLADTPTRGLPTRGLDDLRPGHLTDWSTRRLDNSRNGQVTDWTTRGCHWRLCVLIPMTHTPETGARKLASVSAASVIQSGAKFFWRQILQSDRHGTCSISRQNLATTWSKYWFVIGQRSMLLLFSFVGVVNFVCIFDYWNYLTYSVCLTWVGRIAR